jgi:hypothetical protein
VPAGTPDPSFTAAKVQDYLVSSLLPATSAVFQDLQAASKAGMLPAEAGVRMGRCVLSAVGEGEAKAHPDLLQQAVQHKLWSWLRQHVWNSWTAGIVASLPPFAAKRATWEALSAVGTRPTGDLLDGVNRHLEGHRLACRHYFQQYSQQPELLLGLLDHPAQALMHDCQLLPPHAERAAEAGALYDAVKRLLCVAVCGRLCVEAAHPSWQLYISCGVGALYDGDSMAMQGKPLAGAPACCGSSSMSEAPLITAVVNGLTDPPAHANGHGNGELTRQASGSGKSMGSDGQLRLLCCLRPGIRVDCPFMSCITGCEQPVIVIKQEVLASN